MSVIASGAYLQNRYLVLQPLGRGGLSQTFDIQDGDTVKVLKVLNLQRLESETGRQKAIALFQREAQVLSRLNHPGIPKVAPDGYFVLEGTESSAPGELHCLVMEKIIGQNLEQWLAAHPDSPLDQPTAIAWLRQLLVILETIHGLGLIHRDIKPANIMLKPDGQLVLIDFGGVREVTETYLRNVTGTGLISPGYTPPEQAEGKAVQQSDYFALGRTFVHLLTGQHPLDYDRDSRSGKLLWTAHAPQVTPPFAELIDYLMALMPGRRPQTVPLILKYLDDLTPPPAIAPPPIKHRSIPVTTAPRRQRGFFGLLRPAAPLPNPWCQLALRRTLTGHQESVSAIAISPDSHYLVSASHDKTVKIWSLTSKQVLQTLTGHSERVTDVAIHPDGGSLVSSSQDMTLRRWSLPAGILQQTLTEHRHRVTAVAFSPNGRWLLSISGRETHIWSAQTGRRLRSLREHSADTVRAIAFRGDSKCCAIGYLDGTIECWQLAAGQRVQTLSNHAGGVTSVAFSPNGQWFAANIGRTVHLWDAQTFTPLRTLETAADGSFAIAFSPDSRVLASAGDRAIVLWDPQTGTALHRLEGHTAPIRTLAFCPNGTSLASGSQDGAIKLWLPSPSKTR